ncbi:SdrD B-like domain-containing protein [Iningainema tapete]|uniref:Carboxypeptidase regulatory-like domain-containing protein n=1 Tax=Iningainema tapete BLCC-T55 TaxID=2748662 RepID=A0A8J6XXL5_9CYAN|nr:SdrD B-like domain-containing protein [Iningainema tapete]MBD2778312.1 carboxypeptidase regulatory-like domain-containing protein [Iningainema tapete BLCC-T55]
MTTILKKTNKQPLGFAQSTQQTVTRTLKPFRGSLLTLLFAMTSIPLVGKISGEKVLAQTPSNCPAGTTPRTLEWTPSNFAGITSQTPSVDGITASFSFSESLPGQVIDPTETLISNVIYGGLPGPHLEFNIGIGVNENTLNNLPAPLGSNATLIINFNQPVTLASPLTLLDVDRNTITSPTDVTFQDRVTVTAFNGNTPVGVTLAALGNPPFTRVTGNVAVGIVANSPRDQSNANVSATPSGPVTQIRILYEPGTEFGNPLQDETIGLARINICAAAPGTTGTIGDTVYNDTNGNSTQDANEPGIGGINLNLTGAGPDGNFGTADDITRTTTTDGNGRYSFAQLPPGNYRVVVANPPTGFNPTQRPPETVNLAAGQNLDTVDFGFTQQQQGTIGDTVYNDTNGNSTQDANEPGIGGINLNLTGAGPDGQFGTADDITRTTTTDGNGRYSFAQLPPGNYRVVVANPPAGFSATQVPPETVNLAAGQNLDTIDFGFTQQQQGTIGDTVYNDTNGNSTQDANEPGIGGINISLTGAGPDGQFGTPDDITRTTTTDGNGRYGITNLPPGNYRVVVTNPPAGFSPTQIPPQTINLSAGQNLDTVDFGFTPQQQGTIGDTVYNDTNGNSTQDANEPGIGGINISLTGAGSDGQFGTPDDITRTTTTDGNGRYGITNLPPGNYRVVVTNPPTGFSPTQIPPQTINLSAGQNLDTVDFGFTPQQQGTIGDTVYNDTNGNSTQDANEPGIGGINISLTGAGPDGQFGTPDDITRTTTTDNNGRYSITNLPPGNYRVVVTNPPTGFSPTQIPPQTINLSAGQNLDTVDFGFRTVNANLGGFVFNDRNNNNAPEPGEPGFSNTSVTLTGAGPDGTFGTSDDITRTTNTDNNGRYSFPDLPTGNYRVSVTNPPSGFTPTLTQPNPVTLNANQSITNLDFGFFAQAPGASQTNLRLVKRITNVLRNGQPISGLNFNTFDDGTGEDDNTINQSQPVRGFREIETALQSGDEVEYTLYYLAEGSQDLQNVRFCDLIPSQTSYSADSFGAGTGIVVNRAGTNNTLTNAEDSDQGAFFSPLRPLPSGNTCQNQTNNQGAVILNLGNISPSSNFGFIRFRVRID